MSNMFSGDYIEFLDEEKPVATLFTPNVEIEFDDGKGPKGDPGDPGEGGGGTADTLYVDPSQVLVSKNIVDAGDSLGVTMETVAPYPQRFATEFSMLYTPKAIGGSFWRDIGSRAINGLGAQSSTSVVSLHGGTNDALHVGDTVTGRQAARDALEVAIWIACTESRLEETAWTRPEPGVWQASSGEAAERLSGSAGVMTASATYSAITPAAGDYVGLGYTIPNWVGVNGTTGQWTRGGVVVAEEYTTDPPLTNLEGGDPDNGAGGIGPRAIKLFGLDGLTEVRQIHPGGGTQRWMTNDVLLKLRAAPPWIIIVKPLTTKVGSTYHTASMYNDSRLYAADIDSVVASVTAAYPPLRGKIIVVDPLMQGYDAETMTLSDGLHPNEEGQQLLADLVRTQFAFNHSLREQIRWLENPSAFGDEEGVIEVESVNGQTGAVVLDAADVGAATSAQGVLADSATQPGDLATVATSGSYTDLSNQPAIPDSADDIGAVAGTGITDIVALTQTSYDGLGVKDPSTLYVITGA